MKAKIVSTVLHWKRYHIFNTQAETNAKKNEIIQFQRACGTIIQTLVNRTLEELQLKLYKVIGFSKHLQGLEC